MELVGTFSRAFDLISSEYGWDDDTILDKSLRRIRQIIAAIAIRKSHLQREHRLLISWQTRSLAMVIAGSGANSNEDLMSFAANLTIDNEEYELFKNESTPLPIKSNVVVHAATQESEAKRNFDAAAERNSFDMLAMFGMKVEQTPPGQ